MKEYICREALENHFDNVCMNKELLKLFPTVTKADIHREFVEDLKNEVLRIMYSNNKGIGDYVLTKQLFNEIDNLLSEKEKEE